MSLIISPSSGGGLIRDYTDSGFFEVVKRFQKWLDDDYSELPKLRLDSLSFTFNYTSNMSFEIDSFSFLFFDFLFVSQYKSLIRANRSNKIRCQYVLTPCEFTKLVEILNQILTEVPFNFKLSENCLRTVF